MGQGSPKHEYRDCPAPGLTYRAFSPSAVSVLPGRSSAVTAMRTVVPVSTAAVAVKPVKSVSEKYLSANQLIYTNYIGINNASFPSEQNLVLLALPIKNQSLK